jgi:PKD repeat protein
MPRVRRLRTMKFSRKPDRRATTAVAALLALVLVAAPAYFDGGLARDVAAGPIPPRALESGTDQLALARATWSTALESSAPSTKTAATNPGSTYRWNPVPTSGAAPGKSAAAAMAWDPTDGYVLLFGGVSGMGPTAYTSATWTYENGTWTNITSETTGHPTAVAFPQLAFDPSSGTMILFGGSNSSGDRVNQTWSYHDHVWTNLTSTAGIPPVGLGTLSMATDTTDGDIVAEGGANASSNSLFNTTWIFKDGHWNNDTANATGLECHPLDAMLSDDPAEHGVLMVGASYPTREFSAPLSMVTYVFSGGVWKNLSGSVTAEPPIGLVPDYGGGGWLPAVSGVVFFESVLFNSHLTGLIVTALWLFSDGDWENLTTSAGSGTGILIEGSMTTTAPDSALLVYGGSTLGGFELDTWALSAPPAVNGTASAREADVGQPVHFSASVSQGLDPNSWAWTFGNGNTSSAIALTYAYPSPGVFAANFTATDQAGQSGTFSVPLVVNPLPTVSISVLPGSPVAGAPVSLVPSVAGGTSPFTFAWTLGDGSTNSSPYVVHTYASSGSYTVKLEVTDAVGASANTTVVVAVAAAPSSGALDLTSGTGLGLLAALVALLAVAAVLAVLLVRKDRGPRSPPTRFGGTGTDPGTSTSTSPATGAPPSGATTGTPPGPPEWRE